MDNCNPMLAQLGSHVATRMQVQTGLPQNAVQPALPQVLSAPGDGPQAEPTGLAALAWAVAKLQAQAQAEQERAGQAHVAQTHTSEDPAPESVKPTPKPAEREKPSGPASAIESVPKCHLHRKPNKACKFCKAYVQFQEARHKEQEDRRNAALERLRGHTTSRSSGSLGQAEKVPLPNLTHFPKVLEERILAFRYYSQMLINQDFGELKECLLSCDSCELETRSHSSLDLTPSNFICSVYHCMTIKMTEGQLQGLLNHRCRWLRCAGYLYVRLGVHQDRYWELLSEALMDHEEFVPFPGKSSEKISEGQYVEHLLTKEKYCDVSLPRIATAQRKTINERLVLYEQFRRRYASHLEDLSTFEDPEGGLDVEVCAVDGEWTVGVTTGKRTMGQRRIKVPIRFNDGKEQLVSLGMVILPAKGTQSGHELTRCRGKAYQELLGRYRDQQRESAVASGKDYCKSSGRHTVHVGGVTFVAGEKLEKRRREGEDDEDARLREAKRNTPSMEHQRKMAAIMEKYCGSRGPSRTKSSTDVEGPDRMRLG